ncbi:MAG: chemotaxis protein CheW [Bacteroidales bacterium]|nr:chemotaxis protein CheW [Bacteroidales bacterium]
MFREDNPKSTLYLAYKIGDGVFASHSGEIRKILDVKSIKKTRLHIGNFVDVNGMEVPVLNLHDRLDQKYRNNTKTKSVIIMRVSLRETYSYIGLLVDEVMLLFDVFEKKIQPNPLINEYFSAEYIEGYYTHKNTSIKLINIRKLINTDDSVIIRTWNKKRKLVLVN